MEWKPLDTDSRYEISDTGRVRKVEEKKNWTDRDGYQLVRVTYPGGVGKNEYIHRLVMRAFKPIPNYEKMEVHHIDGNPTNNNLDNLEWVTHQENIQRKTKESYKGRPDKVSVEQYDLEGNFIATYPSLAEAGRATGGSPRHIRDVTLGLRKTCADFVWKVAQGSTTNSSKCCETKSADSEDIVCSSLKNEAVEDTHID